MPKSQIDSAALLAAVVAAAALMLGRAPFDWITSLGGLILLLVLFAYDNAGYRTVFQSLAFSAVCGFCVMLVAPAVFILASRHLGNSTAGERISDAWLHLVWLAATLIVWAIDRVRMGNRQEVAPQPASRALPGHRSFIPDLAPAPAAPPNPSPAPVHREPTPPPLTTTGPELPPSEPVAAQPSTPPPASAPPPPSRPGKETMIYVTLVGEGLNVLRSVKAEHLGRDFYRILDPMPEGETWQFQPGQVVRCKKRNLSSGKALVAIEEAPRSA